MQYDLSCYIVNTICTESNLRYVELTCIYKSFTIFGLLDAGMSLFLEK